MRMMERMSGVSRPTWRYRSTSRASSGRTTRNITAAKIAVRIMIRGTSNAPDASTTAITTASSDQARMSSTAAQARVRAPDRGPVHTAVGEDPGQHRERGDRHRRADEQRERQVVDLLAADDVVGVVERKPQHEPKPEGQRDRGERDHRGGALLAPDQVHVELEPDDEHEDDQPELGHDRQERPDLEGEEVLVEIAGERTQQGRAEQDAGDDLPDDRRLTHPPEQNPHHPGHDHDDRDVDEDVRRDLVEVADCEHRPPSRSPAGNLADIHPAVETPSAARLSRAAKARGRPARGGRSP